MAFAIERRTPWVRSWVQTLSTKFVQDFKVEVQARLWGWSLVSILLLILKLGLVNILNLDKILMFFYFLKLMLNWDSENEIWSRFVQELVIWTQLSGPLCLWQCFSFAIESSLSPTTEEGFLSLHWYSNHDMGCGHPINSFFPSAASVFQTLLLIIWFSSTEESFIGYSQVSKVSRNLGILKL